MAYICEGCSRSFCQDGALYAHSLDATDEDCRVCLYCSDSFYDREDLKDHVKENHSKIHCALCDRSFFLRSGFLSHMQNSNQDDHANFSLDTSDYVTLNGSTLANLAKDIEPDDSYEEKTNKIYERLANFLKYNTRYRVRHTIKGGSLGKGTALNETSDIDMIFFLNDVCSLSEFENVADDVIDRIADHVRNGDLNWASDVKFQMDTHRSVQFRIRVDEDEEFTQVDLLPAANLLRGSSGQSRARKISQIYEEMKNNPELRQYGSQCFSHLQVRFVQEVPDGLKDVIRLLKKWKMINGLRVRSYFLELVAINYWMEKGSPQYFNVPHFFKEILWDLCCCQSFRIVWPDRYDFRNYVDSSERDGPMVLDPANPFENVAPSPHNAKNVSLAACRTLG